MVTAAAIDRAAAAADRAPTEAQREAGNYRKGHIRLHGLDIAIETPAGAQRVGRGWQVTMPCHYGYVKRTEGADGDAVDVFIGPNPESKTVFLIDQVDAKTRRFDEHKAMLGFHHETDALAYYDLSFSDGLGPKRRAKVTTLTIEEFKDWLKQGDTTVPFAKLQLADALSIAHNILRKVEPDNDPIRVADSVVGQISARVARFLQWLTGSPANDIAEAAQTGTDDAVAAVPSAEFGTKLFDALKPLDFAFFGGAKAAANRNVLPPDADGKQIRFEFDARNKRVSDYLASYKMDLIREIEDRQREAIKAIVSDAIEEGLPPARMAQRIRETIGLTPFQAQNVVNFRRELENINAPGNLARVLTRALRDRRYDATLQRVALSGQQLTDQQIDSMVGAYQRRYIAYRAMTIARTESIRATNLGAVASARAAMDQLGDVTVIKTWIATRDGKTRDTHRALDGQEVVGIDTAFRTTAGNLIRWPHDPDAPASETINCRCSIAFRYVPKDDASEDET